MRPNSASVELGVGIFVLLGIICVGYLTFRLGEVEVLGSKYYFLNARFHVRYGSEVGAQVETCRGSGGPGGRHCSGTPRSWWPLVRLKIKEGLNLSDDVIRFGQVGRTAGG